MIGTHVLADFYGITPDRLTRPDLLGECLARAARRCDLTPLAEPVLHAFPGGGVTGFLLLAESHIALHSYPEHGYLAVDLFSCGAADPRAALEVFRIALAPGHQQVTVTVRGGEVGR